jgi:GNAT superfamily N-acetyltransferase
MQPRVETLPADRPDRIVIARELMGEYLGWVAARARDELALDFDAQAMLESSFGGDRIWLAKLGDAWVGVGALKPTAAGIAEIQRMYVRPRARGAGAGRALLDALLADARMQRIALLRLESLPFLAQAHALYRSAGFRDVPPWRGGSMEQYQDAAAAPAYRGHAVFMELRLDP